MNKISEINIMNEDKFWEIISKCKADILEKQKLNLSQYLEKLTEEDLLWFIMKIHILIVSSYNEKLWWAGQIIHWYCSDDKFSDFRKWIIAQGKEIYENALKNPDSLANLEGKNLKYCFEEFDYIPNDIFKKKTGKDCYWYLTDFFYKSQEPRIKLSWSNDNQKEILQKMHPNLFKKFQD